MKTCRDRPGSGQHTTTYGRDEMNLVEFPFATLSRQPSLGSITCVRWISAADGRRHRQSWVVQGGSASGLPTEFDERVYVALLALTRAEGGLTRRVAISVYRILKVMGEDTDAGHYRSVERSLERLLRASIVAEGAFWDAQSQRLVQRLNGFHLIERYWLAYQESDPSVKEAEGCAGYIIWGEEIWHSLQSGYLKQLDLRTFFSLSTPVARRLYRFLDKKLHRARSLEIDIFQLSQQLGMAFYRYPAKVKEKLEPGLRELIGIGFLSSAEIIKVGRYTRMRFIKGAGRGGVTRAQAPAAQNLSVLEEPRSLEDAEREERSWRMRTAELHGAPEGLSEIWEQALGLVRERISPLAYHTWLARTFLSDLHGSVATIVAPNAYLREHIADHYATPISDALESIIHQRVTLQTVTLTSQD